MARAGLSTARNGTEYFPGFKATPSGTCVRSVGSSGGGLVASDVCAVVGSAELIVESVLVQAPRLARVARPAAAAAVVRRIMMTSSDEQSCLYRRGLSA